MVESTSSRCRADYLQRLPLVDHHYLENKNEPCAAWPLEVTEANPSSLLSTVDHVFGPALLRQGGLDICLDMARPIVSNRGSILPLKLNSKSPRIYLSTKRILTAINGHGDCTYLMETSDLNEDSKRPPHCGSNNCLSIACNS